MNSVALGCWLGFQCQARFPPCSLDLKTNQTVLGYRHCMTATIVPEGYLVMVLMVAYPYHSRVGQLFASQSWQLTQHLLVL